jgi:hypothetical protein
MVQLCCLPHNETKALTHPSKPVVHYNQFYLGFSSCPGLYMVSTICNSINSSPNRWTPSCKQDLQVTRARRLPSTCTGTSMYSALLESRASTGAIANRVEYAEPESAAERWDSRKSYLKFHKYQNVCRQAVPPLRSSEADGGATTGSGPGSRRR